MKNIKIEAVSSISVVDFCLAKEEVVWQLVQTLPEVVLISKCIFNNIVNDNK